MTASEIRLEKGSMWGPLMDWNWDDKLIEYRILLYRLYCKASLTHTQRLHCPLYRCSSRSSRSVYRCWTGTTCASSRTDRQDRGRCVRLLPHHVSLLLNRNFPPLTAHFSYVISTPSLRLHLLSFFINSFLIHLFPCFPFFDYMSSFLSTCVCRPIPAPTF